LFYYFMDRRRAIRALLMLADALVLAPRFAACPASAPPRVIDVGPKQLLRPDARGVIADFWYELVPPAPSFRSR